MIIEAIVSIAAGVLAKSLVLLTFSDCLGAAAQLEFQFWQLPERKFGWFVEPSYGYSFRREHE
jgi:hypothetical protein